MAELTQLSESLKKSINTPILQLDPAFMAIVADVDNIILQQLNQFSCSLADLPVHEEGHLLLLAKKEVYWRLATATAPNFDLETEFTKLVKSKRFDHYFKLIGLIQIEIDKYPSTITFAEVTMRSREGTARNYALAKAISTGVTISGITSNSVNLDWVAFDTAKGTLSYYDVLISTIPIYDPYADSVLEVAKAEKRISITDVKRTKYRITNIAPSTHYFVTIVYRALSGIYYATAEFDTLA